MMKFAIEFPYLFVKKGLTPDSAVKVELSYGEL